MLAKLKKISMCEVKFQSFSVDAGLQRQGVFQNEDLVNGWMVIGDIPPLYRQAGDNTSVIETNPPIRFSGRVHRVNAEGEVTYLIVNFNNGQDSTQEQPIRLNNLESYDFSTVQAA